MNHGTLAHDLPLSRRSVVGGLGAVVLASFTGVARNASASPSVATRAFRVATIATSVGVEPDGRPTGLRFSELTTPYWVFTDAGISVDFASIAGGAPPIDPRSLTGPRGRGPSVDRLEGSNISTEVVAWFRPFATDQPACSPPIALTGAPSCSAC
jgi:hypothetical protein